MLTIDGSHGEGGGQILRSSLALAIVTGTPFRIQKIRAGRKKPGLMRQHLTAVQAAAHVCGAMVRGDAIGSTEVAFEPGPVRGGDYAFSIGTAGSTTLVLQTVLLPLLRADAPSRLTLEGGTHNPFAPPFDFLANAYLPLVNRMGPRVKPTLDRPGFFPAGGGRMTIEIEPAAESPGSPSQAPPLHGFDLLERGPLKRRRACAMIANLGRHVAERELKVVRQRLDWEESELEALEFTGIGPGNILTLTLDYQHVSEVFTGFGEPGRAAEAVASDAVEQCQRYLKGAAPAGEYLTDQLMLPLAVAGAGSFRSIGLSRHAQTHIELIQQFLSVPIRTERHDNREVTVRFG